MGTLILWLSIFLVVVYAADDIDRGFCNQPSDKGPCEAFFIRWYYNYINNTCEQFEYGGCDGNENRFSTEDECLERCIDPCFEPDTCGAGKLCEPQKVVCVTAPCLLAPDCKDGGRIKVCRNQYLEAAKWVPCPYGTSIEILAVMAGVSSQPATTEDSCPKHLDDCASDVEKEQPILYDDFINKCDGKILCDDFIPGAVSLQCESSPTFADYLDISYQCVPQASQLEYSMTCVGDEISDMSCPKDQVIIIKQAVFAGTNSGSCPSNPDFRDYRCVGNIELEDAVYYDEIMAECNDKSACTSGFMAKSVQIDECGTDKDTDVVVIGYSCEPETLTIQRCPGTTNQAFDDVSCESDKVIQLVGAHFGDVIGSITPDQCENQFTNSCLIDIKETYPTYFQEMVDKCEGKNRCEGLVAQTGPIGLCYSNERPDYVQVQYRCVAVEITTTESTTTKPESTTPKKTDPTVLPTIKATTDSTQNSSVTVRPVREDAVLNLPLIIGIVAGVVLLITIIVVIVCVTQRSSQAGMVPRYPAGGVPFRSFYNDYDANRLQQFRPVYNDYMMTRPQPFNGYMMRSQRPMRADYDTYSYPYSVPW